MFRFYFLGSCFCIAFFVVKYVGVVEVTQLQGVVCCGQECMKP